MKELSTESLDKIRELAGLFLSIREIALLAGLPYKELQAQIEDEDSQAYLAYFEGKTRSKYEIRQKVVQLAKMGSPQAETLSEKYIEDQELHEND